MSRNLEIVISIFTVAIVAATLPSTVQAERLTDDKFRELHKQLQPAIGQPWRTIPWKIALLDAQRNAAKDHKPIFIWAMDGHPLGCT